MKMQIPANQARKGFLQNRIVQGQTNFHNGQVGKWFKHTAYKVLRKPTLFIYFFCEFHLKSVAFEPKLEIDAKTYRL